MADAPEPVTRWRPAVPAPLERLVMGCLEKRPDDRFRDADELLRALDEAMAITAAPPSPIVANLERQFLLSEVCVEGWIARLWIRGSSATT
jgi:hypothetical protein